MGSRSESMNKKRVIEQIKTYLAEIQDDIIDRETDDALGFNMLAKTIFVWREVKKLE